MILPPSKPRRRPGLRLEALEGRTVPALLAIDPGNVAVSTSAANNEVGPDIAMRPDGAGFVVVWEAPDASNQGVYFQRYDGNWQAVGGATAVNTITANTQSRAAVGMDAAGNFVVTWKSTQPTLDSDVYARRYNADGTAIDSAEFLVNTGQTVGEQDEPDVAVNASGRFVITWWGGPVFLEEDILAKGYTGITTGGSGAPTVAFAETLVSNPANSPEDQTDPVVAIDASGNFVVAYQSWSQVGGTAGTYDVVGRRMNANGTTNGAEFLVNSLTAGGQGSPDVGLDASGNFVIVWQSASGDGAGAAVFMQRYNSSGTPLGVNVVVNTGFTTGDQIFAHVAVASGGDYVVTWTSEETDGDAPGDDSYYKKYNSAGGVLIADTLVNAGTTVADDQVQSNAVPGITTSGDFVIPFEGAGGAAFDVYLRRFAEAPVVQFATSGSSPSEAAGTSSYTVNRTAAPYVIANVATSVSVTNTGGTAAPGTDFTTAFPQTVNIAAGSTGQAAIVTLVNDTLFEGNETIIKGFAASANYTIGATSSRTITIVDDDPAPTVSVSSPTVTEGNSGTVNLTFVISLSAASGIAVTGNYATANLTATAGSDYVALGSTAFTIAPGATTQNVVVTVNGDTLFEANETLALNVTGLTGASNTTATGTGQINNDDATPTLSINDVTVTETDSGTVTATFTVTQSAATGFATTVDFATANGTAAGGSDYFANSGTLTFVPGDTSETVTVTINGDALFEANEMYFVNLTNVAGATIADNQGAGTITDNDAPNSITILSGNNQSTVINTAFGAPLVAEVRNAGGTLVQGVTVNFVGPSAGPGAVFSNSATTFAVTTNASGLASSGTVTANNIAGGPYSVSAQTSGGSAPSVAFDLTNLPPTNFTINDVAATEGNSGTTIYTFTVTASPAPTATATVNWATADNTATAADGDYVTASGTLNFPAGVTTRTISITVNGDAKFEGNETFFVNLSGATNAGIADGQGQGTITNDDTAPTLSIGDVTLNEGNAGTTAFTFTVMQSAVSGTATTVDFATAAGTATAGSDYTTASGTATIAVGSTTTTVTVLVTGDTVFEADQTFNVNLSAPMNASILDGTGLGTITNDDAAPTLTINDVSVSEATGMLTFTVTRTGATELPIAVNYATTDGTAASTAGGPGTPDFSATSGTLNFAPSLAATATQTFAVPLTNDAVYEALEQFTANLSGATGATIGDGSGLGTITDDDTAPSISVGDITVSESGTATFTVTLTGATALPIAVDYATADGTAVSAASATPGTPDYTATTGTLTFSPSAAGTQTLTVTVPLTDDTTNEADETFFVNLSNASNGATIGDPQGVATVTDDDAVPSISITDVTAAEGNAGATAFTFTVSLSAASAQTVMVNFATADGTATAGTDYTAASGTRTFAPGVTTQTVTVLVTGDTVFEPAQTFNLNLSGPTNATILDAQGLGTITNDDAAPTLAIDDVTVSEAAGTLTFTVTRTGATEVPITVGYATADDSAISTTGGPGTPDFTAATGTVNFAPSLAATATQTITVDILDDNVYEAIKQFTAELSNATGATIADGSGLATITNDDAAPTISVGDATANENGTLTFTVTLTGATGLPIGVDYTTADGTAVSAGSATPGTPDYTTTAGTLMFSPSTSGTQTLTVTVPLTDDTTNEADETFVLNLSNASNGATIGDAQAVGTITDDDPPPTVSVNDVTLAEGNAGATAFTFTVTLSAPSARTITVSFATTDGTATVGGADYVPTAGVLTFAPGVTTQTVTVLALGDTVYEADETFTVDLQTATNAVLFDAQGVGTITNDDAAPTLSINDVTVSEAAGTLTFTVTRTGATEVAATVDYATADDSAISTTGGSGTPDYTATTGTLTFAPSLAATATQTITVSIADDNVYEAIKQFTVNLSNPTDATITDGVGLATIMNDDAAPSISVGDSTVTENGTTIFIVTLNGATALPIMVDYATADGTAVSAASATPGTPDYTATSGTLTFAPSAAGTQTLTVTVPLTNDTTNEVDETFLLNLSNASNGATIFDAQAVGTIINEDPPPTASVDDVTVAEGDGGTKALTFTVTLSAPSAQTITVDFATADGTALAGSDYAANAGTLTFFPGATTQTVTVIVNGDLVFEPDQTFTLNLSGPTNATIGDGQGVGTVANDDAAPTLSVDGVVVSEGAGTLTFTVTRTGATEVPITVNYATADGTATAGSDYTAASGTVTFAPTLAPIATQTFTVAIAGDTADESTETFTATLSGATGATIATATGTGTILDDDLPVAVADTAGVLEDGSLTAPSVLANDNAAPGSVAELVGTGTANGSLTLNPDGTFTYAPDADFNGTDTFQYRVRNPEGEVSSTAVTVTVTAVNDAPSATLGANQTVGRSPGPVTVPGWATNLSAGPPDESGQTLAFLVGAVAPIGTLTFDVAPAIDPATGTLTFTPTPTSFGTATFSVLVADDGGTANGGQSSRVLGTFTITVTKKSTGDDTPVDQIDFAQFAASSGPGGPGTADVYNPNGSKASSTVPFGSGVGVRAVLADVTGDGVADLVAGSGVGVAGRLVVTDPTSGKTILSDFPFGAGFTGGLFVAAGDVNADGRADVIVTPDASGGGRVVIYDGATGQVVASFLGIDDQKFRGGARVAVGDVNGDGVTDVIVSAGLTGGPRVAVFDGTSLTTGGTPRKLINDFFAFEESLRDGVYVAAGDLNGDGFADLVFGGGPGGGARVLARDGKSLFGPGASGQFVALTNFFAGDSSLRDGVQVATKNADGDGLADLVTAVQTPSGPEVRLYLGKDLGPNGGTFTTDLDPYPGLLTGIYVG